jgi:AraC-like DNA-binding protein
MGFIEALQELEIPGNRVVTWRPRQLKQFELCVGTAVSWPLTRHFFQGYLMTSILSGAADNRYRKTCAIDQGNEGTFRVFEPEEIWTCQPKDCTFYTITVDPGWLQEIASEMIQRERLLPHFPSHSLFDPSLSSALRRFVAASLAPASRLQQEEMLLHLFAPLLLFHAEDASTPPRSGWEHPAVKRTKAYLQAHYAEDVTLQELGNVAHLSPFYLCRVFHQVVGVPPHSYQTQLRLAHAKTLLAQGFEVNYVAHETGFFDQTHFTKQFKRHFFVTPGSYSKTAKIY